MKKEKKIVAFAGMIGAGLVLAYRKLKGSSKKKLDRLKMEMKQNPVAIENIRGKLYFEIFTAYRDFNNYKLGIYNTIKHKPIPDDVWDNLNVKTMAKDLGAATIIKNGPRFWVMDEILGYYSGETRDFYGYKLDLVGIIEKPVSEAAEMKDRQYYKEQAIHRVTDWIFDKGKKIYELISDKGEVYTMQSVSLEIDKELTPDNLDLLFPRLNLPAGWSFRIRVADDEIIYKTKGQATILQDEFRNTYQKNPIE